MRNAIHATMTAVLWICLLSPCAVTFMGSASAQDGGTKSKVGGAAPACSMETGRPGVDEDEEEKSEGVRRFVGSTCYNFEATGQSTGQVADVSQPRANLGPTALRNLTLNADVRLEAARATPHGLFKWAFQIDWSYYADSGVDKLPNFGEGSISFLGFTVGFAESLMNFWNKEFQFNTAGPNLSSYLVNKEISFSKSTNLAFGIEAGPPSSRGSGSWQFPTAPPYYTSRLKYENNDWILHASSAAHETDTSKTPLVPGTEQRQIGWATSLGAEVPLRLLGGGDTATVQFTYAVNSRVFLGGATDRAALASIIPRAIALPTTGWSALSSYERKWNDRWTSNFFASRLSVDANAFVATPTIRSSRVGANLIYQITDHMQLGTEVSHVNTRLDLNGALGLLNGTSFAGKTGFVWLKWKL